MSFKNKVSVVLAIIIALFGGGAAATNLGSVIQGSEYHSTSTYSKLGTNLFGVNQTIVSNSGGTIGSVIITGAVAGAMKFMDATSTTDVSSTTLFVLPASLAANTYTFDVSFYRGLIVETVSGLVPTSTITYR